MLIHKESSWFCSEAAFAHRIVVVRERLESKEREIHGEWMTEEKMQKSGEFSASHGFELYVASRPLFMHGFASYLRTTIKSIIQYCSRFPQTLLRLGVEFVVVHSRSCVQPCMCARRWKYNLEIKEYFVETQTRAIIKQKEMKRISEIAERQAEERGAQGRECVCV